MMKIYLRNTRTHKLYTYTTAETFYACPTIMYAIPFPSWSTKQMHLASIQHNQTIEILHLDEYIWYSKPVRRACNV